MSEDVPARRGIDGGGQAHWVGQISWKHGRGVWKDLSTEFGGGRDPPSTREVYWGGKKKENEGLKIRNGRKGVRTFLALPIRKKILWFDRKFVW